MKVLTEVNSRNSPISRLRVVVLFLGLVFPFAANLTSRAISADSSATKESDDIVTPGEPVSAPAAPCDCPDKNDLLNRYLYDMIAAQAYKDYQDRQHVKEVKETAEGLNNGQYPQMYSADAWAAIQNQLNQIINKSYGAPTTNLGSFSMAGDCTTEFSAPTDCLRSVLHHTAREEAGECQALKKRQGDRMDPISGLINSLSDYRNGLMEVVVLNESSKYRSEANHIADLLNRLPDRCKQKGWSGTIEFMESANTTNKREIPPGPNGVSGFDQTEIDHSFAITITVVNDVAFFKYDFKDQSTHEQEGTGPNRCHTYEKEPHQYTHHDTVVTVTKASGFGKPLKVSISMDAATGSMSVSFAVPKVDGTYQRAEDVTPPDCGPSSWKPPQPVSIPMTRGEFSYSGHGKSQQKSVFGGFEGHDFHQIPGGFINLKWDLTPAK